MKVHLHILILVLVLPLGLWGCSRKKNSGADSEASPSPGANWYYYNTRAIFLLPRWHGEPGEWEADLTQFADRLGGESGDMVLISRE